METTSFSVEDITAVLDTTLRENEEVMWRATPGLPMWPDLLCLDS